MRLQRFTARLALGALCALPAIPHARAAVDCLADRVAEFHSGFADPNAGFRFDELPGIVLGPPGESLPVQGSTSTLSLGRAGSITLVMEDSRILDGPGPDFIVFENAFFKTTVPSGPGDPCIVFAEPAMVEVSADGASWSAFPFDAGATSLIGQDGTPCSALPLLRGLAGITPTFTGNWTVPDDPDAWDPNGTGGVSGAGGDAFDLADLGLAEARFIRLTDLDLGTGFAGNAEGFDLDAVVALHAEPLPPASADTDGDLLPDVAEAGLYGTDPYGSDTDGDGSPDGVEAARCRDPLSGSEDPLFHYGADLRFAGVDGSALRWNFLSGFAFFDLIRGTLEEVDAGPDPVDLGVVLCVDENSFNLTSADNPDTLPPAPGTAFFYLLRPAGGDYGRSADGRSRLPSMGDCLP